MQNRLEHKPFWGLIAIAALVFWAGMLLTTDLPAKATDPMPDFSFQDESGKTVKLSDFRGKVVILNFWATWCPPCIEEMPSLAMLQKQKKYRGLSVVAVSIADSADAVRGFYNQHDIHNLPVYVGGREGFSLLGHSGVPVSYIVDMQGNRVEKISGSVDWMSPEMVAKIDAAFTN